MNTAADHACADNPLLDALGIRLARVGPGHSTFELDIEPRHLNRQGTLQGGVSATLLDAACGYAGLQTEEGGTLGNAVTLMLAISYLGRVSTGTVRAVATVTRAGRSIYFSSAELVSADGERIATAQGTFKRSPAAPATRAAADTSEA
ncbi:PaaI family thioesterase [Cupriavidus respiraculi]|uniref:PaaI family thioesterase n=1 Tax=Cupriavidus respiraculi TaxID=195930 RepID=UPI001C984D37|nr:PaaI family thioesterase [Cupriavidus respiraculi]MBY4945114.1 PaaI family thioesterase [Cupriavidus respiraculi]